MTPLSKYLSKKAILAAALIAFTAQTGIAHASTVIRKKTRYYKITGSTTAQLKTQMRKKGPDGYWAETRWYVDWKKKRCRVSVKIYYTYPKWINIDKAPQSIQNKWHKMIIALKKHEKWHARNGINAGRNISKKRCKNPRAIINRWAAKDEAYDLRTHHGKTEGIVLH